MTNARQKNKYQIFKTRKFKVNLQQVKSKEDILQAFNSGLFGYFNGCWRTWHLDAFNDLLAWYQHEEGYLERYHLTLAGVYQAEQSLGKKDWSTIKEIIDAAQERGLLKVRYD